MSGSTSSSVSSMNSGAGGGSTASKVVGAKGGVVGTADGSVTLNIPQGALSANTTITIQPMESPPAGALGTTFEIGPTGTTFAVPVTLTLTYQAAKLGGKAPTSLVVMTYADGNWSSLSSTVLPGPGTVSAGLRHLSPYSYGHAPYPLCVPSQQIGNTCTQGSCSCQAFDS